MVECYRLKFLSFVYVSGPVVKGPRKLIYKAKSWLLRIFEVA